MSTNIPCAFILVFLWHKNNLPVKVPLFLSVFFYLPMSSNYTTYSFLATCYKKTIDETKEMQNKIQEELKLNPIEEEVVVLYSGEKNEKPAEFWKGKRIVEMEKPRPSFFSRNLLQKTTQQPATTTDVKPSELG